MTETHLPIGLVRHALASVMGQALEVDAFSHVPAVATPGTLFVRPRPGLPYLQFTEAGWCDAECNLSVVLVAGTADFSAALEWIDERVSLAFNALDANPTLDGTVAGAVLLEVAEPGILDVEGGGQTIGTRFDFDTMTITAQETTP